MFCSRCGKSLILEDQQCPHCGNPVGESRFLGTPYTSVQAVILPGAPGVQAVPSYTRTTYTTMPEDQQGTGDVDSRTTYRPIYEGASAPEDIRRDMRATVEAHDDEEDAMPKREELSDEALETLNAVEKELQMDNVDLSQFRSRPIESSGRAGISVGVSDYIQQLEANQSRRAARKRRVYDEDMDEAYATPQGDYVYPEQSVDPSIDTEQPEVFDDINEEEFDEMRYGRTIGVREILKISLGLIIAGLLIIGGVMGFRYFSENQSKAHIAGVTETLYTQGLEKIKEHAESTHINSRISTYTTDGVLALTTQLEGDAAELDALMPAEAAEYDTLFISALQAIQTNIGNAILMDATAATPGDGTVDEDSTARWTIVNNSIVQLEAVSAVAELTGILQGEQITVVAPETPTPEPTQSYTALSKGDKNDNVLDMQNRLYELGFLLDDRDGSFGSKTQTAVKLFQDKAGLSVTGIADQGTLSALFADDAPRTEYAQATATPKPTASPAPSESPQADATQAAE